MAELYKRLAKKLDNLPHGFPSTPSGVELKILRKIFEPQDAELALKLRPIPATAEAIARRLSRPVDEVRAALDHMAQKGQIGSFRSEGVQKYAFMPFVVGIYEFQLNRLDQELAELFEQYAPTLARTLGGKKPALARVIPVHTKIEAQAEILAYEDMRTLIRESRSFALRECICRKERALLGEPCRHSLETCMSFSPEAHAYGYFLGSGRIISMDEALRALDQFELEGLVHATYNVRQQPMFVCNCCSCCCGFLRGLKEFRAPHMIARSNFVADIDAENCSSCDVCASERCPVDAIHSSNGTYTVSKEKCIGCGTCTVTCPSDAIRLLRRDDAEQAVPPRDIIHWSVKRLAERRGPLTRLALRMWLAHQK